MQTEPYKLKPLARIDLDEIWNYSSFYWGVRQAEKYQMDFLRNFKKIVENPEIGKTKSEIREKYRFYQSNKHYICYVIQDDFIEIVRILHVKMNIAKYLD
jgi:toxin ParE1/3/4